MIVPLARQRIAIACVAGDPESGRSKIPWLGFVFPRGLRTKRSRRRDTINSAGGRKWFGLLAVALGGLLDVASSPVFAGGGIFAHKLESITTAVRAGEWEMYLTGHGWHLPNRYGETTRARLNETNWGGGVGRTYNDDDGDRHSVYFMAFADSHRAPQFNLGYGWQRSWSAARGVSVGAGYLAFVFSREDVANHLPVPALLPCASIRVRNVELIGLYVPRISRDIKGDVVFVYMRVPLGGGAGRVRKP